MSELVTIQGPGLELNPTSLKVLDPNLTIEQLGRSLDSATKMGDTVRWWIGDLLLYAESRWGEESAQLLDETRISERQSQEYRWVAEKIAPSVRTENLSFSHHRLVAPLEPPDQRRLLALAEHGGMAVSQFREAIRDHKAFEAKPDLPPTRSVVMSQPTQTVDVMRGLRGARETLQHVATGSPEAAEALKIGDQVRGIDKAAKIVRRADLLEELLVVASEVLDVGVRQSGLPDPAVIVPSAAWDKLLAAHQRAIEGRRA